QVHVRSLLYRVWSVRHALFALFSVPCLAPRQYGQGVPPVDWCSGLGIRRGAGSVHDSELEVLPGSTCGAVRIAGGVPGMGGVAGQSQDLDSYRGSDTERTFAERI